MTLNEFRRITVPLGRDEWERLREAAQSDYRHPREQARYLLRLMLFNDLPDADRQKSESGAEVSEAQAAAL